MTEAAERKIDNTRRRARNAVAICTIALCAAACTDHGSEDLEHRTHASPESPATVDDRPVRDEAAPATAEGSVAPDATTYRGSRQQYENAAAQMDARIATNPANAILRYRHALVLLALERCDAAAERLDQARRMAPADRDIAEAWIRTRSSCAIDDPRPALAVGAELFAAQPDAPQAEAYAMALAAVGQFERAVQLQQRVAARIDSNYSRDLLQRFRDGRKAGRPWADDAPIYHLRLPDD